MTTDFEDKNKILKNLILISLSGMVIWILEAILAFQFDYSTGNFWYILILDIPPYHLVVRLVLIGQVHIFGAIKTRAIQQKNKERKVVELEKENLAKMVENSNDAFINMDLDGNITYWNKGAENTFGYTSKEVMNRNIQMVPSNRQDEKDFVFNTIRKGEKINHLETKRLRKDGKILDISINYSPYFNHKDHVMGIFSIARDFTETFKQQRRYQDQLLKASQFKSEFMATMSHELRTPLNSIIGFSDIILEKFYGEINEKQEKYIYNVRSSADHLLNLVDDILDISSIEAGTVNLICENLNLNVFFNQITNMFRKQCASKKLSFEIIGLHEGMNLKCDPRRLKEIFINLLSNALKYTMEGGVKIEILEKSDQWIFSIIDTGIGIKEEDFKFIFQDFVRLKTEYTELIEGTGLGLSLTKRLIEIQNGVITFRSKWGEGSTFIFTLPKSS